MTDKIVQHEAIRVTPGRISYTDRNGKKQVFYFQANPTSLTRARNITLTQTQAADASGTKAGRGEAGRKFTLRADNWKIEGLEITIEAAMLHWVGPQKLSSDLDLDAVKKAMEHLEALAEPGPVTTENDPKSEYPPLPGPPSVLLSLGDRTWQGFVTSVRIEEKQFTPKLAPMRVRATLSFEVINTPQQLEQYKKGGRK